MALREAEALDPLIANADKALRQMRQVHLQEGKADNNLTLRNNIGRHRRQVRLGSRMTDSSSDISELAGAILTCYLALMEAVNQSALNTASNNF